MTQNAKFYLVSLENILHVTIIFRLLFTIPFQVPIISQSGRNI